MTVGGLSSYTANLALIELNECKTMENFNSDIVRARQDYKIEQKCFIFIAD